MLQNRHKPVCRRSPHGERGLKCLYGVAVADVYASLPARGAWIEMAVCRRMCLPFLRRSPHGERGLKLSCPYTGLYRRTRRSPHGERGLKYLSLACPPNHISRSPHGERGLKLTSSATEYTAQACRSPHGERGLKCRLCVNFRRRLLSLPARGAWIEIKIKGQHTPPRYIVAPRTGSVD